MSWYKDKLISIRVDSRLYNEVMEIISKNKRWKFDFSFSDLVHYAMEDYLKKRKKKNNA